MKKFVLWMVLVLLFWQSGEAQTPDFDVYEYSLELDLCHKMDRQLAGKATLTIATETDSVTLDLRSATVDSVLINGIPAGYSYNGRYLKLPSSGMRSIQPVIYYHTGNTVESYGWGGLHIDGGMCYNLGVAFEDYPHSYGRAWMPCHDDFQDKATYRISITCKPGWRTLCSGIRESETLNSDSSITSVWVIENPTPTYLIGFASAPLKIIERTYQGIYGEYPAMIGFVNQDSAAVWDAYAILEDAVPMYERCFGPYRWGRIGYVGTPKGSMEHANNISLVNSCMASMEQSCQSVIVHELAHAWFGNLITCAESGDMWINEGGATFCEEIAMEAAFGKSFARNYHQNNLFSVLTTAHLDDGGYIALHGVTPDVTYGTTTYHKGATVWHSLRGYLGEEVFYAAMQRLFTEVAFGNLDADGIRDSLSHYTGVDLTGFFDFHVFNAGFNDYRIDSLKFHENIAEITLSQHLLRAPEMMNSNRIPVTFHSGNGETHKHWFTFNGENTTQSVELPLYPAFAILDEDCEISHASILSQYSITATGTPQEAANAYFSTKAVALYDTAQIYVSHHFTAPGASPQEGIIRTANRYWTINAIMDWNNQITGRFRYARGKSPQAIDYGFYNQTQTLDSMALVYRPDAGHPWQIVSLRHTSNADGGTFILEFLRSGEYTLAVVDTALLGIAPASHTETAFIAPNPSQSCFTAETAKGRLIIYDLSGNERLRLTVEQGTHTISHNLPAGTYIARLVSEEGTILKQQKIIILE